MAMPDDIEFTVSWQEEFQKLEKRVDSLEKKFLKLNDIVINNGYLTVELIRFLGKFIK